jgi:hypothetical protein
MNQVAKLFGSVMSSKCSTCEINSVPVGLWSHALAQVAGTRFGAAPEYVALQAFAMTGWTNCFEVKQNILA